MDDILYILIGIAWVAYSFYSNKQKQDRKKAAREIQGNPVPQPTQVPTVKSILEEILMGEVKSDERPVEAKFEEFEPEYLPTTEAVSSETIRTEAESLEVIADEVPANYFEMEYAAHSEGERVVSQFDHEPEIETDEPGSEIARDFDLRTAVIYAEILNPRHF
jgi:hypothetical protein